MTTILQGIGWFLLKIYEFFESCHIPASYALMLVVFTILIKVVIFPLSYKGKKSMMKMSMLQSKQKKLEQMYGNNRQKYQEEVQKLYEREKVNPMGGCLWSFLPLPILMALYVIIRRPMMYLMGIPDAAVTSAIKAVADAGVAFTGNQAYHELQLAGMLKDSSVMDLVSSAIPDYADKLSAINFNFFGIDLSQVPTLKFWTRFRHAGHLGLHRPVPHPPGRHRVELLVHQVQHEEQPEPGREQRGAEEKEEESQGRGQVHSGALQSDDDVDDAPDVPVVRLQHARRHVHLHGRQRPVHRGSGGHLQ